MTATTFTRPRTADPLWVCDLAGFFGSNPLRSYSDTELAGGRPSTYTWRKPFATTWLIVGMVPAGGEVLVYAIDADGKTPQQKVEARYRQQPTGTQVLHLLAALGVEVPR